MKNGYLIVEPASLLSLFGNPKCADLAILVLHWAAKEIETRLDNKSLIVEVIRVEYMGAYPALGVRGGVLPDGLENRIEEIVGDLLGESSVRTLISYATSANIDWRNFSKEVLG